MGARRTAVAALGGAAALIAASPVAAVAAAPTPEDVAKRLVRAYDRQDRAAICRLLSPDFAKLLDGRRCERSLGPLGDYDRQIYAVEGIDIVRTRPAVVDGDRAAVRMTLRFRIRTYEGERETWVRPERIWLLRKPGGWRVQTTGMVDQVATRRGEDFPPDLLDPPAASAAELDLPPAIPPVTAPCTGPAVTAEDPARDTRAIAMGWLAGAIFPRGPLARSWVDLRSVTLQMDADTKRPCVTIRLAAPIRRLTRFTVRWYSPRPGERDVGFAGTTTIRVGADGQLRFARNIVNELDDPEYDAEEREVMPDVALAPDGALQVRLRGTYREQPLFRVGVQVQSTRALDPLARERWDAVDLTTGTPKTGPEWPTGGSGAL